MEASVFGPIVSLTTELLKFLNKPEAVKTVNAIADIDQKIASEKARGQMADYSRIETWTTEGNNEVKKLMMLLAISGAK